MHETFNGGMRYHLARARLQTLSREHAQSDVLLHTVVCLASGKTLLTSEVSHDRNCIRHSERPSTDR